jgi:RNA polymerase sigma factor (sigma-70 family)
VSELLNADKEFAALYSTYSKNIYYLSMSYCNDADIAKDLLQDTFISIWKNKDKFRGDSQIGTWIYRIAVNTCLGYIRQDKKNKKVSLEDHSLEEKMDENSAGEERAIQLLYEAIQQLEEADRLIISMVLQELPYDQIAQAIGIREGTLRVKIHRIKQQLATIYSAIENK